MRHHGRCLDVRLCSWNWVVGVRSFLLPRLVKSGRLVALNIDLLGRGHVATSIQRLLLWQLGGRLNGFSFVEILALLDTKVLKVLAEELVGRLRVRFEVSLLDKRMLLGWSGLSALDGGVLNAAHFVLDLLF